MPVRMSFLEHSLLLSVKSNCEKSSTARAVVSHCVPCEPAHSVQRCGEITVSVASATRVASFKMILNHHILLPSPYMLMQPSSVKPHNLVQGHRIQGQMCKCPFSHFPITPSGQLTSILRKQGREPSSENSNFLSTVAHSVSSPQEDFTKMGYTSLYWHWP